MQVMYCWPTQWLEAAQCAGLSIYEGNGKWAFLNDGMRDLLAGFARDIVCHAVDVERNECASIAEGATANTQFQTIDHYKIATAIAAAIRERSNVEGNRPPRDQG